VKVLIDNTLLLSNQS